MKPGEKVSVFYNDTPHHVARYDGIFMTIGNDGIVIKVGDEQVFIPTNKLVRVCGRDGETGERHQEQHIAQS